jgi:hypothetical protein
MLFHLLAMLAVGLSAFPGWKIPGRFDKISRTDLEAKEMPKGKNESLFKQKKN